MSLRHIIASSYGDVNPYGAMDAICRAFDQLQHRIDVLEKRLNAMHPGNPDVINDIEFIYSLGQTEPVETVTRSYTSEQVKSPDQQKMSIEKFKQAFGQKVADDLTLCQPIPYVPGNPEQKKEEVHPAHSSSFVLKI